MASASSLVAWRTSMLCLYGLARKEVPKGWVFLAQSDIGAPLGDRGPQFGQGCTRTIQGLDPPVLTRKDNMASDRFRDRGPFAPLVRDAFPGGVPAHVLIFGPRLQD